jgi:p-aminobenzoyl-glutamate transporter AbgT
MSLNAFLLTILAPIAIAMLLYLPVHMLLRWYRGRTEANDPQAVKPKRMSLGIILGALLMMCAFIFGMAYPTLAPETALGNFLDDPFGKTVWMLAIFFIAHQFDRWYAKQARQKTDKSDSDDKGVK